MPLRRLSPQPWGLMAAGAAVLAGMFACATLVDRSGFWWFPFFALVGVGVVLVRRIDGWREVHPPPVAPPPPLPPFPVAPGSALQRVGRAARAAQAADPDVAEAVRVARVEGHSWEAIGVMLGLTGLEAEQQFNERVAPD